uniref:Uncharacterized protein n=1 Tax=Anopheles stephensi TaxID=30069 RepID=A0A182YJ14_ANOST
MVSAGRVNITRGIQTIRPETTNRYCQVSVARIRKPTATIHVQTEESLVPPVPVFNEIGCQTDEPLPRETCVGVTQTEAFAAHPVQRDEVGCQTVDMMTVDEPIETRNDRNVAQAAEQQQDQLDLELEEAEKNESTRVSVTNMLNDFAKQYGIDLQSPVEKKRPKSGSKKKEIEHLQECLANKTYKAMASKVNEKLGNLLEKHITEYGRETVASRERLIRWTKSFIRRQQRQNRAAAASAVPSRKIVLVRKVVRAPQRPAVEEKGVQCVPGLDTVRVTVGTQWQRQKPTVTKKTPVSGQSKATRTRPIPTKPTSTDSKTCSAGARQPMRQTKLSSYAKELDDASSKPTKAAAPPPPPPQPAAKKRTRSEKKALKETTEICIEETPSPPSSPTPERSDPELDRKHFPYRSPPTYPTQCSKATETSFLTPSRARNLAPELMNNERQSRSYHNAANINRSFNPAVLLSPLERMYVDPAPAPVASSHRPEYNTFLVPLRSTESVPPTPQRIMYLNPPERRVLLRSGPSSGPSVREKPPEISIISSQQLYSQIGLAVEKALKNQTLPTLASMYGEPFVEVFNGGGQTPQRAANEAERSNEQAAKQQQDQAKITDKFVCSSGKVDAHYQGSQQHFVRPPFHTDRSPSLSPIVYDDENSGDEMIL